MGIHNLKFTKSVEAVCSVIDVFASLFNYLQYLFLIYSSNIL